MTSHWAKNVIFVTIVVLGTAFGNLLLAIGIRHVPDWGTAPPLHILLAYFNPALILGTAILLGAMIAQLAMYTWADMSYVLPVTAIAYVLAAVLGKYVLGEQVHPARWVGTALIAAGAAFVSLTDDDTRHRKEARS